MPTPVEIALGLLATAGDPEAAKARLDQLREAEARITDKAAEVAAALKEVEAGKNALAEAQELGEQLALTRGELESLSASIEEKKNRVNETLDARETGLEARERRVEERETAVSDREHKAEVLMAEAERTMAEAEALGTKHREALNRLRSAMPE